MFIHISKAYLHADVLNDSIYVELPGDDERAEHVWKVAARLEKGPAKPPELGKRSTLRPLKE